FYGKRSKRNHKLIPFESSRSFDGALEIQVFDDVYSDRFHDDLMYRISDDALVGTPSGPRIPVDIEIVTQKCRFAFLDPGKSVGEISGNLAGPWSFFRATFPTADVKQHNIARP